MLHLVTRWCWQAMAGRGHAGLHPALPICKVKPGHALGCKPHCHGSSTLVPWQAPCKVALRAQASSESSCLVYCMVAWQHSPNPVHHLLAADAAAAVNPSPELPFLGPWVLRSEKLAERSESDMRVKSQPRWQKENFAKNVALVEEVKGIAAEKGCTPGQLALAWVLHQGDDVFPIPGDIAKSFVPLKWQGLSSLSAGTFRQSAALEVAAAAHA